MLLNSNVVPSPKHEGKQREDMEREGRQRENTYRENIQKSNVVVFEELKFVLLHSC